MLNLNRIAQTYAVKIKLHKINFSFVYIFHKTYNIYKNKTQKLNIHYPYTNINIQHYNNIQIHLILHILPYNKK